MMDGRQQTELFAIAQRIASALGGDFVGRVELNIFKGGIGTINVTQTLKQSPERS